MHISNPSCPLMLLLLVTSSNLALLSPPANNDLCTPYTPSYKVLLVDLDRAIVVG